MPCLLHQLLLDLQPAPEADPDPVRRQHLDRVHQLADEAFVPLRELTGYSNATAQPMTQAISTTRLICRLEGV